MIKVSFGKLVEKSKSPLKIAESRLKWDFQYFQETYRWYFLRQPLSLGGPCKLP